jgi:hypothetical protein
VEERDGTVGKKIKIEICGCRIWSCCVTGARPLGRRCRSWLAAGGEEGRWRWRERFGEILDFRF